MIIVPRHRQQLRGNKPFERLLALHIPGTAADGKEYSTAECWNSISYIQGRICGDGLVQFKARSRSYEVAKLWVWRKVLCLGVEVTSIAIREADPETRAIKQHIMQTERRRNAASPDAEGAPEHVAGRLPVELWTDIASWCSRSAVYRLCLVSRTFYLLFNPVLYKSLLTEHDSVCPALLRTLSSRRGSASLGPHPASLVRDLFLNTTHSKSTRPIETTLKNTSLFTDKSVGSRLRALTWDIREVPANIALLLQDPVAFPCLKEMSLRFAWRMFNAAPKSNMRIFLNPGLEKLSIEYRVCNDPSDFLKAHPAIQHLKLRMETTLADDLAHSLPHLRTFCGYECLCRNFLGSHSTLQELTILRDNLGIVISPRLSFAPTPSLRTLHVFPHVKKMKQHLQKGLSPKDLEALATSFPELTSLDMPLLPPLPKYARELALFTRLRTLTVRFHCANLLKVDPCVYCGDCHIRSSIDNRPVEEIYPIQQMKEEIEADLVLPLRDLQTLTARVTSDGILSVVTIDESEIAERDVEDSKVVYEFSIPPDEGGERNISGESLEAD
ncbi:uncharacterized protein SCHCODRAFT_02597743 [Schizophyllum commune H4-8]|uniref:F-box domain-containing protein n=1 Tax=Schizophyllum commune (strain H4-8 / FGSC 9210) TaxID=578458 RepID=D8PXC4_SCHCM|nr:uncharacterized protein SCHCODRAFT_02597743 [Schizophyllum commune H4-8]KAI5896858.1 hypothetical protein SCHCODRAFT_02597743 [Schizophyllum commune H4-8]